jgi:hypothetical protein
MRWLPSRQMTAVSQGSLRSRSTRGGLLRRLRLREDAFALALLIEVAAFVVAPGLHLINHKADHTHGPDGVTHTHRVPHRPGGGPAPAPFKPHLDEGGSALHFGLALTAARVFLFTAAIGLALLAEVWLPIARAHAREIFEAAAPRGPPLAA